MDRYILLLKHLSDHMYFLTNGFQTLFIDQLARSKATCPFKIFVENILYPHKIVSFKDFVKGSSKLGNLIELQENDSPDHFVKEKQQQQLRECVYSTKYCIMQRRLTMGAFVYI